MDSGENQVQVFPPAAHRSSKSLRDFHIPAASARDRDGKSGNPTTGFRLSHARFIRLEKIKNERRSIPA